MRRMVASFPGLSPQLLSYWKGQKRGGGGGGGGKPWNEAKKGVGPPPADKTLLIGSPPSCF